MVSFTTIRLSIGKQVSLVSWNLRLNKTVLGDFLPKPSNIEVLMAFVRLRFQGGVMVADAEVSDQTEKNGSINYCYFGWYSSSIWSWPVYNLPSQQPALRSLERQTFSEKHIGMFIRRLLRESSIPKREILRVTSYASLRAYTHSRSVVIAPVATLSSRS